MSKKGRPDIRERFGYVIRLRRDALEMTQEQLAEKARVHRTYLADIERGKRNVSLINIDKIAAGLSWSMSELFRQVDQA